MTVPVQKPRKQYEGPYKIGDTAPIPFKRDADRDVKVIVSTSDVVVEFIFNSDYTVLGDNVTFLTAVPADAIVTLYRETPLDNQAEFPQESKFDSNKINAALDRTALTLQEFNEDIGRAIKLPLDAPLELQDLQLPVPIPNLGIKWGPDGTKLINTDFDPDIAMQITEEFKNQAQGAATEATIQKNLATAQATKAEQEAGKSTAQATLSGQKATASEASSVTSSGFAEQSRKAAIGTIQEYPQGSAKYWAERSDNAHRSLDNLTPEGEARLGQGLQPGNTINKNIVTNGKEVSLTWTDPRDVVVERQVLSAWDGTMVFKKAGSYPTGPYDGELVVNSKQRNQYSTTPFVDTNIDDQEYFYTAYPYSNTNAFNKSSMNRFGIVIYGYKLNKANSNTATCCTPIEGTENEFFKSAKMDYDNKVFDYGDWENAFFVKGNKPVMLNPNGTIAEELDPNDYTKTITGVASSVSNVASGLNAMSQFPLIWKKKIVDGNIEYVYLSNQQADSDFKAYAFYNKDGELMPYTYMPMFDGSYISGKMRSLAGQATGNSQTASTEVTYALANGEYWYTEVHADIDLLQDLLLLIGMNTNTQEVFGNGHYTGGSAAGSLLQTGTLKDKGQFSGTNGTGSAVKVYHMENPWGNTWRRKAGHLLVNGVQKVKYTWGRQDGSTQDGYDSVGSGYIALPASTPSGTIGGYISSWKSDGFGRYPTAGHGSSSTYLPDGLWYNNAGTMYALVGGDCYNGLLVGAFALNLADAASAAYWNVGAALSCKPPLS